MSNSSDFSKRSADTTSTATQNSVASSEGSKTLATVTTGNKNRVADNRGSNSGNVTLGAGTTVQSIDPATIAGAFGLTKEVVENLAALANNYVEKASGLSESSTAQVAIAFDKFGQDLTANSNRAIDAFTPDGGKDKIILTALAVGGAIAVAALFRKSK